MTPIFFGKNGFFRKRDPYGQPPAVDLLKRRYAFEKDYGIGAPFQFVRYKLRTLPQTIAVAYREVPETGLLPRWMRLGWYVVRATFIPLRIR